MGNISKSHKRKQEKNKRSVIRVLNLYAGIGGNRKLWNNVEVTAVEINQKIADMYKSNFPEDKVVVGDAHQYLLEHYHEFDFIWSSPPCPSHSVLNNFSFASGRKKSYPDMRLYEEIIFLGHFSKSFWVVENVVPYYSPLIPFHRCGRHAIWSNFRISDIDVPPDFNHYKREVRVTDPVKLKTEANKVNPKIGLHIFNMAFKTKQSGVCDYA